MRTKKSDLSQLWKRNAVVAAIALFVCAAVYLNWNYGKEGAEGVGKTLGQSTMVGGKTQDPLVQGNSSTPAAPDSSAGQTGGDAQSTGQTEGTSNSAYFATARPDRCPPQPPAGPGQRPVPAPGRRRP